MIAVRIKERFYNPQTKSTENRFLDVLVMDKSGKLFSFIEQNPRKYVTAVGTLQIRVYQNKPQLSVLADNNDGFSFADCIDREAVSQQKTESPAQGFDDSDDLGF